LRLPSSKEENLDEWALRGLAARLWVAPWGMVLSNFMEFGLRFDNDCGLSPFPSTYRRLPLLSFGSAGFAIFSASVRFFFCFFPPHIPARFFFPSWIGDSVNRVPPSRCSRASQSSLPVPHPFFFFLDNSFVSWFTLMGRSPNFFFFRIAIAPNAPPSLFLPSFPFWRCRRSSMFENAPLPLFFCASSPIFRRPPSRAGSFF